MPNAKRLSAPLGWRIMLLSFLIIGGMSPCVAQTCSPSTWSPALVVSTFGSPPQTLTGVVAHRGLWYNVPENSLPAMVVAHNDGIEAVEIDIRETQDNVPVAVHDWALGRITNTGGDIYATSLSTFLQSYLKMRDGVTVTNTHPAQLSDLLQAAINNNLALSLDIKNIPSNYPGTGNPKNTYGILQDVVKGEMSFASSIGKPLSYVMSFVSHKVLWKELPAQISQMQTDLFQGQPVPDYFHLIGVQYDDGSTPPQAYASQLFFRAEPGVKSPQTTLEGSKNNDLAAGFGVGAFSEVFDWPEGKSQANGQCCSTTNSNVSSQPVTDGVDYRGDLNFVSGYMKSTIVITDRPVAAVDYLSGLGQRNTSAYCSAALSQSKTYKIQNYNSGLLVGVTNESTAAGANVIQFSDNGTPDHLWNLVADQSTVAGSNIVLIKNVNSGLYLSAPTSSNAAGGYITQQANQSIATRWALIDVGNDNTSELYQIRNLDTGQLLGVSQESTQADAQICQYTDNGTPDHIWRLNAQ